MKISSIITSFICLLLTACSEENTSAFTLNITDAAVSEADAVIVQFNSVELHSASGDDISIKFDQPKRIDLLQLQGTKSQALVEDYPLPAGKYQSIRLGVDIGNGTSVININGTVHDLNIPSGKQSGLKLVRGFEVPANGEANFTIEFDIRKSVTEAHGEYKLRPTLRLVDNVSVGHLKGEVDLAAYSCDTSNAVVYVYQGTDITPFDINNNDSASIVSSAIVKYNEENTNYTYEIGYLNTGSYTIALTCEANLDNPEQSDDIDFAVSTNVEIEKNSTTIQNL